MFSKLIHANIFFFLNCITFNDCRHSNVLVSITHGSNFKHNRNVHQLLHVHYKNTQKCLFTYKDINHGPYSHILVQYMVFREDACMSNALIWILNCFEAAKKLATNFFAKSTTYTYLRHRNTQKELKSLSTNILHSMHVLRRSWHMPHIYTKDKVSNILSNVLPYIIIIKSSKYCR